MDLLGTRRVDPVHQSPRTRAYGFFTKGTVPTSLFLAHLVSFLLPTVFAGRLPRPTSVAGCPVTWLSPRFIGNMQPSDYLQSLARHFAFAYRSAYSGATRRPCQFSGGQVLFFHIVPSATTLVRWLNENAFAPHMRVRL